MRDDHVPNGRPIPFGRVNGSTRNGVAHADCVGGLRTRVLPVEADAPVDLMAVQADDELVNALGTGGRPPAGGPRDLPDLASGGPDTDDRLVAMIAAWRAEIEAEPIPELLDLDTAVAAVAAGVAAEAAAARRRRSNRLRHLAPLAAAAAIIVATVSGVGLGSQNAQPGDALWSVQKVLDSERAESVEAKVTIETRLASVRTALSEGDTATAARELDAIRAEIPTVRGQDGRTRLVQEQEFLAAKLQDTRPGRPADLSTPPSSEPNARPTGGPSPVAPAVDPSQTGAVGSTEPTAPLPSTPDGRGGDESDRANVPVVPPGSETGEPSDSNPSGSTPADPDPSGSDTTAPDAGSSAPEASREPDSTSSEPAPGTATGSVGPTTAPAPPTVPAQVGGTVGGTVGGSATAPSNTTTASGSVGATLDVTATVPAN